MDGVENPKVSTPGVVNPSTVKKKKEKETIVTALFDIRNIDQLMLIYGGNI